LAKMEKNIYLEIEYLGTNYFGFQVQAKAKHQNTIQAELEKALAKLSRQKIRIAFAGRTDRGVHAKGQVANFKVDTKIPLSNIKRALNAFLPPDIRVKKVKKVPLDFHARFSAASKVYRYLIFNKSEPSVFCKDFAWHIDAPLNLEHMKRISKKLIGAKDFYLFAKEAKKYKDCIRNLKDISIKKKGVFLCIDIEASGFLRSMARNIVAFLVKVGTAKLSLKNAALVLERKAAYTNKPAPGCGLYLYRVKYT
jgi:tRNA pseudouridine38-40 synthase